MTIQNQTKIPPENNFQTIGSTHIKTVEAFNKSENNIIENHKEAIIIYGLDLFSASLTLAHKITGKSGKTHGARIVKTQARNDTINNVIIFCLKIKDNYIMYSYLK